MIRDLIMFTLRCIIALSLIGWAAEEVFAQKFQMQCEPLAQPDPDNLPVVRCDPGSLDYNTAPEDCRRT